MASECEQKREEMVGKIEEGKIQAVRMGEELKREIE